MTSQNVEVKLELGHRANLRDKTTTEGYTHDWTLFVRGPENCNIQHFVEKVVFFLHESFPKPKRVLKEPPYHVTESGYAGFNLAIEVHFRNKEDPKKVRFDYDLYLHLEGPPIHNSRLEKLTFQNPNQEFRKKLLKGGGVAISGGSQSSNCSNSNPVQTETEHTPKSKSIKGSNEGPKKTPKVKLPLAAKETAPAKVPESSHHPFTHIFGAPLKTKSSPETGHKTKDNTKDKTNNSGNCKTTSASASTTTSLSSSSSSSLSTTTTTTSSSSTSLQNNNVKSTSKESHKGSSSSKDKVSKASSKEVEKKESKSNSESGSNLKRSSSPSSQNQSHKGDESAIKKRRRSTSTSSATSSAAEKTSSGKDKKPRSKEKEHKKEHKDVKAPQVLVPPKKETQKQSKPAQVAPRKEPRELKSPVSSHDNDQESISPGGRARPDSESSDSSSSSQEDKEVKQEEEESQSSAGSGSSPSSSLTLSSITPGSAHGPLATMMAQMEQELVSPLSSDQASPAHSVASPEAEGKEDKVISDGPNSPVTPPTPVKLEEKPSKKNKEKRRIDKPLPVSKKAKEEMSEDYPPPPPLPPQLKNDGKQQPIDPAYLRELMQLQKRIMALSDKQHLQRIVDVIEETGLYQITSSTIDFDLCALDRSTVQKLQNCMTVT